MDPLLSVLMGMLAFLVGVGVALRFVFSLPRRLVGFGRKPPITVGTKSPGTLMSVLGSGGHTAEMISILSSDRLVNDFARIVLVHADTDSTSRGQVLAAAKLEPSGPIGKAVLSDPAPSKSRRKTSSRRTKGKSPTKSVEKEPGASWAVVPRSREVGQSWITSAAMTAYATVYSIGIVFYHRPALLLLNGPGTCVPLAFAAWLARLIGASNTGIVFVESAARVADLSMTGKILYYTVADRVLVYWKGLKKKYRSSEYCGLVL